MSEPVAVLVPQINPNDEQAVVVRWHIEKGARVRTGQTLVTLETTKTTFDVDAPQDGYAFFEHEPNSELAVGAPVVWIAATADPFEIPSHLSRSLDTSRPAPDERFTRKALKLMKQHGLAAADFPGEGRIDADAVETAVAGRSPQPTPAFTDAEPLELAPSKITEIQTLSRVYEQVVPSTVAVALMCERMEQRARRLEAEHGPVSFLEICIYEAARLLPHWPEFNAFYAAGSAWKHRSVAIGFAVNLGKGLRVPVVRDTARLSLLDVARTVRDLSLRYMRDGLTIDDLTGGTFTVTDLSAEGVVHFVPVLNDRQSAILGLTAERSGARARDLVLTFDHRLSDGMRAARFLAALRDRLEGAEG